jgi:hypothetical protein
MRTGSTLGMIALLGCVSMGTARAAEGKRAAASAKAAPATAPDADNLRERELLHDSSGKPVTVRFYRKFFDSEGKEIPVRTIPLSEALICIPPPEKGRKEKLRITDYTCVPFATQEPTERKHCAPPCTGSPEVPVVYELATPSKSCAHLCCLPGTPIIFCCPG